MRKDSKIGVGALYFYVHFVTEVMCFYFLGICKNICGGADLWVLVLAYDMLAFVPQSLIGYFSDKHQNVPLGTIGIIMMSVGLAISEIFSLALVPLIIICLGNCFTHVNGAQVTLRCSEGKLFPSAFFVAGGSFGVITGRLLATTSVPWWLLCVLSLSAIPFTILAQFYLREANGREEVPCKKFNYSKKTVNGIIVVLVAVFIVVVRGYMGYGIPTSWNKTVFQTISLYCAMGIGKGLGGLVSDLIGVRKTAILSTIFALPLLLFGDQHMMISLIGVMFFSMTMSITLALLVSALPKNPGLAFGLTTIGLFMGTAPIFFFKFNTVLSNCIVISILTVICIVCIFGIIRKDEKNA